MTGSNSIKTKRELHFDILRAMACLAVVLIHVSAPFVVDSTGQFDFWTANALDSAARIGVPVFVMISGALFLDENRHYTYKTIFRHVLKMAVFFLCWSLFYVMFAVAVSVFRGEGLDVGELVFKLFEGEYHLWFVPMIIGLYAVTPLLKLWIKKENKRHIEYFLVLSIMFSFVIPQALDIFGKMFSQASRIKEIIDGFHLNYTKGFVSYFILGWYLNTFEIKNKNLLYAAGISGLLITMAGTYFMPRIFGVQHNFYGDFTVNVLVYSATVFMVVKNRYKNKAYSECKTHKIIKFISKNSLAIYAMHVLVVNLMYQIFDISIIIKIPLMFISATAIPIMAAAIIGKIPILKKYIV